MLSRRQFLAAGLALGSAPLWANLIGSREGMYVSAFSSDGNHFAAGFNDVGNILWHIQLPERAHAPVLHPTQAVAGFVARRPGFYMDFVNVRTGDFLQRITPTQDHHFYGHALFSHDGDFLITQENHFPTGEGKIFVRRWPSAEVVAEYSSGGIGPHEAVFLNSSTIVIANGGLRTHPDNDRDILNLDTMAPNLTYLNWQTGEILQQVKHADKWHQLSIRHLDVNQHGEVVIGCQHQGEAWEQVPLVAVSRIDATDFRYLDMPEPIRARFKQYCGSVCFDKSGELVAISTPRGGFVAYWRISDHQFIGVDNCRDVCGLSPSNESGSFILTSGTGKVLNTLVYENHIELITQHASIRWDNHLRRVTI
ncbi:DUF1513 domain-containing protein [Maribrevibacterium harenarium]|uniref:DUF1513 domain-containing protein n=1 Tax=Maribrevibacterium harenarium TaxID=2589817 RepID=A0A501WJY2_9GAMM|nr:DUF1513 domain-containing protein [Maribrevibacterium harenarium]TPE47341.1 DUF1513 domain-containing protein [Maribrevibacterium harenarium]